MQQRHSVDEALQRARTEMEPLIHHSFANETLEQPRLDSHRQRRIQDTLDRDETLFQMDCVPHRSPECNALFDVGVMQVLRTHFEQPGHRSRKLRGRDAEGLTYMCGSCGRHVGTRLHEVQLAIADDDLVGRKIIVNVRKVNR